MMAIGKALVFVLAVAAASPAVAQDIVVNALCANAGGGSSTRCENYGGGQFSCSNQRTGIGMISEGGGRRAVFVDGKVIMTPN